MNIKKECNNNVIIVEDFLSYEEKTSIANFMESFDYKSLKTHDWEFWGNRQISEDLLSKSPGLENALDPYKGMLTNISNRIKTFLDDNVEIRFWDVDNFFLIKMAPNYNPDGYPDKDLEMFIHIDNQEHMTKPVFWGAVIYLNDGYIGGEIYYPEYNYAYKPKSGALALHEGNIKHGVKRVLKGNRYCLTTLVSVSDVFNQNPMPMATGNPEKPYFYPVGYNGARMPDDPIQGTIKVPRPDGSMAEFNPNPRLAKMV